MIAARRRLREVGDRILDPATINDLLDGLQPDQRGVLWKLYRASRSRLTANETRLKSELLQMFRATSDDISQDISQVFSRMGATEWNLQDARRLAHDRALFMQVDDRIGALSGQMQQSFDGALLNQYKIAYFDAGYRLDALTPDSTMIKFGMVPDQAIASMLAEPWSGARFSDRLGLISSEMSTTIKHQLIRSMMAEESWADAARRIRDQMGTEGQRSVWRAEMIARTELSRAQNLANSKLYDDNADVIDDVVWVAHPGACDVCVANHGQPVSEVGTPPEDSHPNCSCDQLAVPKSWGGLAQTGDGDFSIRPQSRQSWAEMHGLTVDTSED